MDKLEAAFQNALELARSEHYQGVLEVCLHGETVASHAFGLADRRYGVAHTRNTRLGIASGTKGFTALTVMRLVELGVLRLDTAVVGFVGEDLPLVDPAVSVAHLLAHRSGIGDYLDEDTLTDINDYIMSVPVHQLAGSEDYLVELHGHPQTSPPGACFAYNNGGYVLLALVAERAVGKPFHELVDQHVCQPAGLSATGFVRGDQLDETVAVGYLEAEGLRTNVYHLPVSGSGDGGMVSTTGDIMKLWGALFGGQVVAESTLKKMVAPRSDATEQGLRYGMGFWLAASGPVVQLEGYDAGISFKTAYNPVNKTGYALISNTSDGVWPLARVLGAAL